MSDCAHFLIALTIFSVLTAAWGYLRARTLHFRIEARFPGFNDLMREYQKRHRKR